MTGFVRADAALDKTPLGLSLSHGWAVAVVLGTTLAGSRNGYACVRPNASRSVRVEVPNASTTLSALARAQNAAYRLLWRGSQTPDT